MGNSELAPVRTFSIAVRETYSRSLEGELGQKGRYSAKKSRKWAKKSKLGGRFFKSFSQAQAIGHKLSLKARCQG